MKKVRLVIVFVIFNILLFGILYRLNYVLAFKDYSGAQAKFAKWNPEHADIVFVGNSHQFCSVNPDVLYDDYGIESFMLATSAQTLPQSYYAVMEAIELKHPEKIVFEISYTANDFFTVSDEMTHCFMDGMPRCEARKLAMNEMIEKEDRIYYRLPLGLYHSRWKELEEKDYKDFPVSDRGTYIMPEVFDNWEIPVLEDGKRIQIPQLCEEYLIKIIDLCKESGVELILYVAPFNGLYDDEGGRDDILIRQAKFNYAFDIAKERGIPCYNLFETFDDIGIDSSFDWADSQHLNKTGQEKLTKYLYESKILGY